MNFCLRGDYLDRQQLSVIHRLPDYYHWSPAMPSALTVSEVVHSGRGEDVVIFELLDSQEQQSEQVMLALQKMLAEVDTDSNVIEWRGTACLLVASTDEATVNCCLKNNGVAIAENFPQ